MPFSRNYGFKEPTVTPDNYVFGGFTTLKGQVLVPDGNWQPYLPEPEFQSRPYFDTNGCAIYGTLNALECLLNRLVANKQNWSERFIAVMANSDPAGNNPHTVIEAIRKNGLLPEADLPFDDSITSWTLWASPKPMLKALLDKAKKFLHGWTVGHEWVSDDPARIMDALQYSPLGVAVYAWTMDETGLYHFPAGLPRNHWCLLVGYKPQQHWLVFDSYDQVFKRIAWDSKFIWIKRYYLSNAPYVSLLTQAITLAKKLLELLLPPRVEPPPKPALPPAPIDPAPPTPMSKLYTLATSLIGTDASPKDLAKDGVGCAESVSTIIRKLVPTFPLVTGTWSLWDALRARTDFQSVNPADIQAGDIILCVTGTGNGKVSNGHVGILAEGDGIMSNDSLSGIWKTNFTRKSWNDYFVTKGGYPVHYFRLK